MRRERFFSRLLKKSFLDAIFVLVIVISAAHFFSPVRAQPTYSPGVTVGDSVTFGLVNVTWRSNSTPPSYIDQFIQTRSIQLTVTSVVAKTVSANMTFFYKNGTSTSSIGTVNVQDGNGNLGIWILAGGLSAGYPVYANSVYSFIPYIQETTTKLYAGALRSVNAAGIGLNSTSGGPPAPQLLLNWDAQTGFLLEAFEDVSFPGQSYSIHFKVTNTNVWSSSTSSDFGFDAIPQSSQQVHLGASATYTLLFNSTNSFAGTINLTPTLLNSTQPKPTLSLSRTSVLLPADQSNSSTLTFSTNDSTPLGLYIFSVNGTSGSLSHTTVLAVTVSPPDFDISAHPANLTITVGSTKNSEVTVRSLGSFSGTINLSLFIGGPLNATLQPTTVTLSPTVTSANSTLTVRVPSSASPGPYYYVGVTGTSGVLSHSLYLPVNVTGPDFQMSASPSTLTLRQGTTAQSTVTLTSILGFHGDVFLNTFSYGVTSTLDKTSVFLNSTTSATATLTISAPPNTQPGFYYAYVNGNSGNLTRTAFVTVNVVGPDFSITTNPSSFTLQQGTNATSTITLTSVLGFHGNVALNAYVYNFNGPSVVLNPANLTLSANATATSQLTIFTSSAVPGYYTIQIAATGGNLIRYVYISVQVLGPDFDMSTSPFLLTLQQGSSATSTITLSRLDNFNGTIALSTTVYSPYPGGLTSSISPPSVTLSPATTSAKANLTITASPTATPGSYTVQVLGTSGRLTHYAYVQVEVTLAPDFQISATSPADFNSGAAGSSTITITPLHGFTGIVALTTSTSPGTGLTPRCPTSLTVTGTAPVTGTCYPTSTTPGTYHVGITATGGGVTHTANFTSSVGAFKVSAGTPIDLNSGAQREIPIIISSLDNFSGEVALTGFSSSPGLTVTCPAVAVALSAQANVSSSCTLSSTTAGTYSVTIVAAGSPGSFTQSTFAVVHVGDFTIAASSGSFNSGASGASITISITSKYNFAGSISLSAVVGPSIGLNVVCPAAAIPLTANATSIASCTLSSTSFETYRITVTGKGTPGTASHDAQSTVHVGDFAISIAPMNINFGSIGSISISLTSLNNFAGAISLSDTTPHIGYSETLTITCPIAPSITANSTVTISCSVTSTSPGTYLVTITGTGSIGDSSHSASTVVHIGDFTIHVGSPVNFNLGSPNSMILLNLTSTLNFAGTIVLTAEASPENGLTITCPAVTLTANSSSSIYCTFNANTTGTFLVTIKGSSLPGTGTHSSSGIVQIADFTVSASAVSPSTITAGGSGSSSITVATVNGFAETVTLAVSPPSGIACSFDHTTIQSPGTSILSCTGNTPGDYTLTVTAIGSSTFHQTHVTFHVASAPAQVPTSPTMFGLQLPQFYTLLGGVIVAITVAGVTAALRRKK